MPDTDPPETRPTIVLERDRQLSQSIVWQLQQHYFEQQGIEAWRNGAVPHYITSNPFFAHAYARVVDAYLRDCEATALCPDQPLHIIELGAGPGRFAFHFLKRLMELRGSSSPSGPRVRYVMTDFAGANVNYWRQHASLQPFLESGYLDLARFDAQQDGPLELVQSGDLLAEGMLHNPLVIIANYFFDCIPQDVFAIQEGKLHEARVTITSEQPEPDLSDPGLISRIQLDYDPRATQAHGYYEDPDFNQILADYEQRLGDTGFLIPIAGLRTLRYFLRLSAGRALVLCADKGFHWEEDLFGSAPEMVLHGGSFSMMLNFDALGRYVTARGGRVLSTSRRRASIDIAAFLAGEHPAAFPRTRDAFDEAIERFGPDDYFTLVSGLDRRQNDMTLEEMLAWLRLGRGDTGVLMSIFPALIEAVPAAPDALRDDLYTLVRSLAEGYFDIGEEYNLPFYLGTLLYTMGYYAEAQGHLERAAVGRPPDARTLYNLALCRYAVGELDSTLDYLAQALAADAACQPAKALRIKIESMIKRRSARPSAGPALTR